MMICVTNRKLCRGDFLERIEQLAAGGADAILLREKDLSVPEYAALAKQCLAICQAYHTPLWLNSFREVAGALQLPVQLPMPILRTLTESQRAQLPAIGASVHSPEEAVLAEKLGASWLIAGHIFATACKPDLPPRGWTFSGMFAAVFLFRSIRSAVLHRNGCLLLCKLVLPAAV